MKKVFMTIFLGLLFGSSLSSCTTLNKQSTAPADVLSPDPGLVNDTVTAGKLVFPIRATASEVIAVKDYVYIKLDDGLQRLWIAVSKTDIEVGDELVLPNPGLPMENYFSDLLDRSFGFVYFSNSLLTAEKYDAMQAQVQALMNVQTAPPTAAIVADELPNEVLPIAIPVESEASSEADSEADSAEAAVAESIEHSNEVLCRELYLETTDGNAGAEAEEQRKLCEQRYQKKTQAESPVILNDLSRLAEARFAGRSLTLAELFDQKDQLAGEVVRIRCKVTKFSPKIMGRNWAHIQDGTTSSTGNNDLSVTTLAEVEEGDLVLVQGKVVLDKDFGAGYAYDVLIEDANLIKLTLGD